MRAQRNDILPLSLPPLGIGREQAAALIGISATMFDRCVEAGSMPSPRALGGRLLWDVSELTAAFRMIPHRVRVDDDPLDEPRAAGNPWD
jgi:predicted DNA-binding transcriptional regulator AlpA